VLALAAHPLTFAAGQQGGAPVARTIEGRVLDPAGRPLGGAVVLLEDLKSLQVRSYIVQQDGKYHFRGLSSDANYELRARFNGVESGAKTVSVFQTNATVLVNLKLPVKHKRPKLPNPSSGKAS
jgi:hypothetical protein